MAPAPAQVAAVPLVGEPAHDRVTVPATDLPSCEFGASTQSSEVLLRCRKSEALSPGGRHGSQPSA